MRHTQRRDSVGLAPSREFSIVQHNSLGSWDVFLSLFNSFASARNPPSVVCLQDPPFCRNRLLSFEGFSSFAPPTIDRRPRMAFYVSSATLQETTVLPVFTGRSDIATLEIHSLSLFSQAAGVLSIVNCYSVWGDGDYLRTVAPPLAFPAPSHPTLIVGDFNIHHPLSDPLRTHSQAELHASFPYFHVLRTSVTPS